MLYTDTIHNAKAELLCIVRAHNKQTCYGTVCVSSNCSERTGARKASAPSSILLKSGMPSAPPAIEPKSKSSSAPMADVFEYFSVSSAGSRGVIKDTEHAPQSNLLLC